MRVAPFRVALASATPALYHTTLMRAGPWSPAQPEAALPLALFGCQGGLAIVGPVLSHINFRIKVSMPTEIFAGNLTGTALMHKYIHTYI